MPRKFWWPGRLVEQASLIQSFRTKIVEWGPILGMSPDEIAYAIRLCDGFLAAYEATEYAKRTMVAMTTWRDSMLHGTIRETATSQPPQFLASEPFDFPQGIVPQFFKLRDRIMVMPNYSDDIGIDLGLLGTEITQKAATEVSPSFKSVNVNGSTVTMNGSLEGNDALRVEYASAEGTFRPVAFLTNLPSSFNLELSNGGQPEAGTIRSIFIKRSKPFGNYSPTYSVVVS